jgi:alpha-beta hydrolase superfamily lysophospholipase
MPQASFEWVSSDGLALYAQEWQPEAAPKATVCLVHGLGEHGGRYAHLGASLTNAGYALLAFDQRGHGRSAGPRGHTPSLEVWLDDIDGFLVQAAARYPSCPRFLYGHSLGGSQALLYVLQRHPPLQGVIVTAPALRLAYTPPSWKATLSKVLASLWPTFTMASGLEVQALSRDAAVLDAYRRDPLVHDHISASAGWGLLRLGELAFQQADELTLPLLLMHGSADRIVSCDASREFAARTDGLCTLRIWDGLYHEIHNEAQQEQVFALLVAWLDSQLQRKHD